MIKEFHFKDVEKYLRKYADDNDKIIQVFSELTSAAVVFSSIALGPEYLPLLEILDVSDKLCGLGKTVINFISDKIEPDYLGRLEQLKVAYGLIYYTAYFDRLEYYLPKKVRKKIRSKYSREPGMLESGGNLGIESTIYSGKVYYVDHLTSIEHMKNLLLEEYKRITQNIIRVIDKAEVFDMGNQREKSEREVLIEDLRKLPEDAVIAYEAQYIALAAKFNDFALFAQLKSFEKIHEAFTRNETALSALMDTSIQIDIGLNNLKRVVSSIPTSHKAMQVQDIVDDLKLKYTNAINEPIIEGQEVGIKAEEGQLQFPKIVDAFIPQYYKCLQYQDIKTKLEDEANWHNLPVCSDLDKFFIQYLYSPDSIDYPLIILGQPGSGKSLLTKVLSAQLMSNAYTVVRIPLREVNAENGIDVLVEDQIRRTINRPLGDGGYGGFAKYFSDKPLIIILDGYDELLQAKGKVYSGYLEKIRRFQEDQKGLRRPVRVIVTSRITLLDKARIPVNSTILRLMEFDAQQREAWIKVWNTTNAEYFASAKVRPFTLPSESKKRNSILELAEQPLLLMMLALYDSEANELVNTSRMRRTELYDNLSRRFIRRERSRYVPYFSDKTELDQERIIDREMERYGVIAIGMYNRKDVVIRTKQLEEDLQLFQVGRGVGNYAENTLNEADSVVGSFFFIHKSTAQEDDVQSERRENAYEFLHNTFGEFFAADFILRNMIREVRKRYVYAKYAQEPWEMRTSEPLQLANKWYYCLMLVPLFTRPVVVEMLREHTALALKRSENLDGNRVQFGVNEFIPMLDKLVKEQLRMILSSRKMPEVMCGSRIMEQDNPLLGLMATYSLNLIILAASLNKDGIIFKPNDYSSTGAYKAESGPWNALTSLWKAWFPTVELVALSGILTAKRDQTSSIVSIKQNKKGDTAHFEQPIEALLCVSHTLADPLLTGLSGLQSARFSNITSMNEEEICVLLKQVNINMYLTYLADTIRNALMCVSNGQTGQHDRYNKVKKINKLIDSLVINDVLFDAEDNVQYYILDIIERCLNCNALFLTTRKHLLYEMQNNISKLGSLSQSIFPNTKLTNYLRIVKLVIKDIVYWTKEPYYGIRGRNMWLLDNVGIPYPERIDILLRHAHDVIPDAYETRAYGYVEFSRESVLDNLLLLDTRRMSETALHVGKNLTNGGMEFFMQLSPEWCSALLLRIVMSSANDLSQCQRLVEIFFEKLAYIVSETGFPFIDFSVFVNALKIAKLTQNARFTEDLTTILHNYSRDNPGKYWFAHAQTYPRYYAELLEELPNLMGDLRTEGIQFLPDECVRYCSSPDQLLSYLRVFRLLDNRYPELRIKKKYQKMWRDIARRPSENVNLRSINLENLSLRQLKDLIWHAKIVNDKEFLADISLISGTICE